MHFFGTYKYTIAQPLENCASIIIDIKSTVSSVSKYMNIPIHCRMPEVTMR